MNKAHNYLCQKNKHYHNWHHHKHHKKIHRGILALYVCSIMAVIIANISQPLSQVFAQNSTKNWDLVTSNQYNFDSDKIEFSQGVAQLKAAAIPGTDWITSDSSTNNWAYRKPITISNTGGSAQTDYQVLVIANTIGEKIQDDCDDLRFTDSDKITPINYWVNPTTCNTATTKIWIKIPSIATPPDMATIYMYYGNTAAISASNGANVFQFFDDFNDNLFNAAKWAEVDPSNKISEGNGKLQFLFGSGSGNWDAGAYSIPFFARSDLSLEYDLRWTSDYTPYDAFMFGWKRNNTSVNYSDLIYGYYNQGDGTCSSNCIGPLYEDGSGRGNLSGTWSNNTDYLVRIRMRTAGGAYYEKSTDGGDTWTTDYASNYSTESNLKVGFSHYSGDYLIDNVRIRKYSNVEPTSNFGTESTLYPTDSPTLIPKAVQGYSTLTAFSQSLGSDSTGNIKYQISPNGTNDGDGNDNTSAWYWWNGSAWTTTIAGNTESNLAADINTNINTFGVGSSPKYFKWKAFLYSDGSQLPKLDNIALQFVWDTAAPPNPTIDTANDSNGGAIVLNSGSWYNYTKPYFTWQPVVDIANNGEAASGIVGYYVYFGEDPTGLPKQARGIATEMGSSGKHFQIDTDFEIGIDTLPLEAGKTYYLRATAVDNAGNPNGAGEVADLYVYKFDNSSPIDPSQSKILLNVSTNTGTLEDEYTFYWPAVSVTGGAADYDPSQSVSGDYSGVKDYQYKIGEESQWVTILENQIVLTDPANGGTNTFFLRVRDNALNASSGKTLTFYTPPTSPSNLTVSPNDTSIGNPSGLNSFAFSWDPPVNFNGTIKQYRYSVNTLPTENNTNDSSHKITSRTVGPRAFATQQGENRFYVVAEGILEGVNYTKYAAIKFYVQTAAPAAPQDVLLSDFSKKDKNQYKVLVSWSPSEDADMVGGYEVYHSTDGSTFSLLATTAKEITSFTDSNLDNKLKYYYQVKTKDGAGQSSDAAEGINDETKLNYIIPTGKYSKPPTLVEGSINAVARSRSATISWSTQDKNDVEHKASGKVFYGLSKNDLRGDGSGQVPTETKMSNEHSIVLTGLQPETPYFYRLVWSDGDNEGTSDYGLSNSFITTKKPEFSHITVSSQALNSVVVNWESLNVANSYIEYCKNGCRSTNTILPTQNSKYSLQVSGLEDTSTYAFKIKGTDTEGGLVTSDENSFTTLEMPKISNLRFETVTGVPTTTVKCTWTTNVITTSIVDFSANSGKTLSKSNADLIINHEILISDLTDQTTYQFFARGVDAHGIEAKSPDSQTFTTPNDTRPPKLSDLTIEVRSSGVGAAQKSQALVSWISDEPGTSQVEYGPGISSDSYPAKSQEDAVYTTNHVVIVSGLDPAKLYHLRAISKDKSANSGTSVDTTVITGKVQKSVVDLIMNSLQKSLGFLSKLSFLSR